MEYLKRIEEEKEKRTGTLYLGECGLREWPEEIFEMDWLEELIMSDMNLNKEGKLVYSDFSDSSSPNVLSEIPKSISQLRSLKKLYISGTYLHRWTIESLHNLSTLVNLHFLHCRYNNISKIENLNNLINLNTLYLRSNQITKIENLDNLINLNSLDLRSNQITKIENLDNLINLNLLDLRSNQITKIENLDNLIDLISLFLSSNQIAKIENLDYLINLISLDFSYNKVTKIENLNNILSLKTLDLRSNQITKIENLDNLINLNFLALNSNQITKIENLNILTSLKALELRSNQIAKIENLDVLPLNSKVTIYNNPIKAFPHGLLGGYQNKGFIKDLRNWNSALGENPPKNTFTKILILGNGNVGKSSLVEALRNGKCDHSPESTHGIELSTWETEKQHYHIWDFGGQEIFHGTHQMFFIGQAIQIIVFDHDSEEEPESADRINSNELTRNRPINYWIHQAEQSGNQSPIIIVQNKVDERNEIHEETHSLSGKKNYPYIRLSAKEGINLDELIFHIHRKAKDLYEYEMPIPPTWVTVRDGLLQKQKKVANRELTMSKTAFFAECMDYGVSERVLPTLLTFLHNSGFLYYNASHLGDTLIIDQKWALEGIYTALDREGAFYHLMRNGLNGIVDIIHLYREWDGYREGHKKVLLSFMQSCGICTPVNKSNNQNKEYLFPEFLNEERPEAIDLWEEKYQSEWVHFTCEERFFPSSKLHHFIVKYFKYAEKANVWYNGILLKLDSGMLILEFNFEKNILSIKLTKNEVGKWLAKLAQDLGLLDKKYTWSICNAQAKTYENIDITRYNMQNEANYVLQEVPKKEGINIAISYAKEDDDDAQFGYNPLQELLDAFSTMRRNKEANIFTDKRVKVNNWDKSIRHAFQDADLIIILNSTYYGRDSKDYIWSVEMPIIEAKLKDQNLSVCKFDICEYDNSPPLNQLTPYQKKIIPIEKHERTKYFKDFIEEVVRGKVMKNLGLID